MAIQYIQERPSLGALLGQGLGQGASSAVQGIIDQRLKNMQMQQQRDMQKRTFMGVPGMTSELADFLAMLDPKSQATVLSNLPELMQQFGQPSGAGAATAIGDAMPDQAAANVANQNKANMPDAQTIANSFKTAAQKRAEQDIRIKEESLAEKKRMGDLAVDKFNAQQTQKFVDTNEDLAKSTEEDRRVLAQMEQLNKEGLINPSKAFVLQALGLEDVAALSNPASEQFKKLQNYFLRNLKNVFGGRITDREVTLYMQGIPSLFNSEEGRRRIIEDLRMINNIRRIQVQEYKNLQKAKKGKLTKEDEIAFQEAVDQRTAKFLDKTSFIQNIKDEISTSELKDVAKTLKPGQKIIVEQSGYFFEADKDGNLRLIPDNEVE